MTDQSQSEKTYIPVYGDLTSLNTCRLIKDTIGESTLKEIARNYLDLLETSGAIYEVNGDYALGIFSSGWCQCLDSASRDLCKTEDNVTALNSGKWICHECCWNEASKESIKTKEPVEIECKGGIYLYAVPIIANGKAVGSMNFGHGSPPTDAKKLQEISALYQVDLEKLVRLANEYTSRPPQIIKAAKSQLLISAKLIGQIIEQKQVEKELVRERDFSIKLIDTAQAIILVLNPDGTIQSFNAYMEEISGYKLEEVKGRDWFETFLPSQDWKKFRDIFRKAIGNIQTRGEVNPIITKNGDELYIEWWDKTLTDSESNIVGLLSIGQDITRRKQAEEALQKAHDELELKVKERTAKLSKVNKNLQFEILERIRAEDSLRLYSEIVAHMAEGILLIRTGDGIIVYINPKLEEMFGYDSGEILGKHVSILNAPTNKSPEETAREIMGIMNKDGVWQGELLNIKKDGTPFWCQASVSTFEHSRHGEVWVSIHTDITARKKAEDALRESEELFRDFFEGTDNLVTQVDTEGHLTYVNNTALKIFGISKEECIGLSAFDFIHPEDREKTKTAFNSWVRNRSQNITFENRQVSRTGQIHHMLWTINLHFDEKGNVRRLNSIARDVTELKQAEANLKKAHDELEQKIEERTRELKKTHEELCERVKELDCLYGISKITEKYNTIEKVLQGVTDLIPPSWQYPEITCAQIKLYGKRYKTDNFTETEWLLSKEIIVSGQKAGAVEVYYLEAKPIIYEGPFLKEERSLLNVIAERLGRIIESKLAEEALKKTQAQLLHSEKLSAIGSLSASISHEFNNPLQGVLNVIKGVSKRESLDEDDTKLMEMAVNECNRMRDLIRSLQDFNRPTSGRLAPMDIHAAMDSILLLGKKEYRNRKITIEKVYAEEMPQIKAVADQIKQVFLNLLNNAADACEEGCTITIRTEAHKDNIVVRIQDTGAGIKPEDEVHIFEPFFTTKPLIKGTGLGLSVSYGIIKRHGGTIDVESEFGRGTIFSVTLPIEGRQNVG